MALSKEKKIEITSELASLLAESKLTVIANYRGLSVQQMQELRRQATGADTKIKVVKNRLVKKALEQTEGLKDIDTSVLNDQLLYAFNSVDEVAGPQVLRKFSKVVAPLEFIGAISPDGKLLSAEDVTTLASLPSKEQLRAQLVGTISAPLSGFANVLKGNLTGFINVLNAKSQNA